MSELFKIKPVVRVDHFDGEGNAWSGENYARQSNAETALLKVFGQEVLDGHGRGFNYTTIRNLSKLPLEDMRLLRDVYDRYVSDILPQFMALKGPFTYGTGDVIETADGRTFDEPIKAARHILDGLLSRLFLSDGLSDLGRRLICNASIYSEPGSDSLKKSMTDYAFRARLNDLISITSEAPPYSFVLGQEERMAKALHKALVALQTPIPARQRPRDRAAA